MLTKNGCPGQTWESPSNLNVLYKSFHVHRNMSRFWSFPLISFWPNLALSLLTNGLTPHEVLWLWEGGGGLSFLLTELFLSARAREKATAQRTGPWPLESTLSWLCVSWFFSQHSSRQSASWGCELLPTSLNFEFWSHNSIQVKTTNETKAKLMEVLGISHSLLLHHPYGKQ